MVFLALRVGLQIGVAGFQLMARSVRVVPPSVLVSDNFGLRVCPFVNQRLPL